MKNAATVGVLKTTPAFQMGNNGGGRGWRKGGGKAISDHEGQTFNPRWLAVLVASCSKWGGRGVCLQKKGLATHFELMWGEFDF